MGAPYIATIKKYNECRNLMRFNAHRNLSIMAFLQRRKHLLVKECY